MGEYGISIVQELYQDCEKICIVTDAIELLHDGYPLDEETKESLTSIGVDYVEFTREFQIRA